MRKIAVAVVALVGLSMGACCPIDKNAVSQLRANDDIIMPAYVKYVDGDASLNADQKNDRKKLVESRKALLDAIEKAGK
jgi:hypothetical protein